MKSNVKELPAANEAIGEMVRAQDWGGTASAYLEFPAGLDFGPMLEGLEGDHCQCPHWGYVIEGRVRVGYMDGTEEVLSAGDLYYLPPGHTVAVEEAVRSVEFSPQDQMAQVLAHVVSEQQEG